MVVLTLNVPADDDIFNNNKKKSIFKAQNLVPRAYNILAVARTLNSPVDNYILQVALTLNTPVDD